MPKLTVIVPCKNEEENIRTCLESVKWADELMVVDSGSTDRTLEIAHEYTDRILEHEYVNSATQKNWAIPQAAHEWVFIVDSDEKVTPELQSEVRALMAGTPKHDGYRIRRKNWFFGVEMPHCGWERDTVLRLFRRDVGRYEDRHVHADVIVDGAVGHLENNFEHRSYRSFDDYLEKFGRYTTWSALDLRDRGKRPGFLNLVVRPFFRFFKMFVIRQGFRSGLAGFILCGLGAFSVFMKYAKLWVILRADAGEKDIEAGRTEW